MQLVVPTEVERHPGGEPGISTGSGNRIGDGEAATGDDGACGSWDATEIATSTPMMTSTTAAAGAVSRLAGDASSRSTSSGPATTADHPPGGPEQVSCWCNPSASRCS